MGIDIYVEWNGQTDADKETQRTGWSTRAGHVGYLREAYHGGPYATRVLLPEAFAAGGDPVRITAATLRERLSRTVLAALVRDLVLYQNGDPGKLTVPAGVPAGDDLGGMLTRLAPTIIGRLRASRLQPEDFEKDVPEETIVLAGMQIALGSRFGWLPPFAQSYVDFVDLVGKLEAENKEPMIVAST